MLTLKVHPLSLFDNANYPAFSSLASAKEGDVVGVEISLSTKNGHAYVDASSMTRVYLRQGKGFISQHISDCPQDLKGRAVLAWWALALDTNLRSIFEKIHSEITDEMEYTTDTCGYSVVAFRRAALILEDDAASNIFEGAFDNEPVNEEILGKAIRVLVPRQISAHQELEIRADLAVILDFFRDYYIPLDDEGEEIPVTLPAQLTS